MKFDVDASNAFKQGVKDKLAGILEPKCKHEAGGVKFSEYVAGFMSTPASWLSFKGKE